MNQNPSNGLKNISSLNFNVNVDSDAGDSAIALPGLRPGELYSEYIFFRSENECNCAIVQKICRVGILEADFQQVLLDHFFFFFFFFSEIFTILF